MVARGGTQLDVATRVSIGSNLLIAPCCFIANPSHAQRAEYSIASQGCEGAPVRIDYDVWLSARSIVLLGVSTVSGAIICANSIVTGHVDSRTIVVGSPVLVVGVMTIFFGRYR